MKDHQLKAWLRLADTGSIRAAARSLHLSQAAVTKAIRELEAEVDAQLVLRSQQEGGYIAAAACLVCICKDKDAVSAILKAGGIPLLVAVLTSSNSSKGDNSSQV